MQIHRPFGRKRSGVGLCRLEFPCSPLVHLLENEAKIEESTVRFGETEIE